jgi:hypothetical protein
MPECHGWQMQRGSAADTWPGQMGNYAALDIHMASVCLA